MFVRFSIILKCGITILLISILFSWLSSQRSRLSVEDERLTKSYQQSSILFSGDEPAPSYQQSSIRFSTEGAAVCRQTSASTDAIDRKQCHAILKDKMSKQQLRKQNLLQVTWQPSTLDDYVKCTSDCDRFRSELGYWTSTDNISKEELEFPLAFR